MIENRFLTKKRISLNKAGWALTFLLTTSVSHMNKIHGQTMDSLAIKIGQMIMIGMPKAEVDSAVLHEVGTGKVGAIILFEKNIPKTNSYAGLKKMIWTYQKSAPIPLFVSIDQEGGKVNRLKEKYGFPRSITAAASGKAKTLDSVRFYAGSTATTLAGLGFNVNFAPCVDLAVNPDNTVIVKVERSFSANEDTVTMMAREYVREHRKAGVITSLKHFPGHGSSKEDTHFGVADVTTSWSERELKPYQSLLVSGDVDAVMTSHIVNKKLDQTGLPGTLSTEIIDGVLRKKLGFQGVVFSDDMQMHAITKQFGMEESIRLAVNAGVDILCFSNNIQGSEQRTVEKVHTTIKGFVESGQISKARIDDSFRRIMKLKKQLSYTANDYRMELLKAKQEASQFKTMSEQNAAEIEKLKKELEKSKKKKRKKNKK
jgi:beta-N-acetylhexosaminidase